MSQLFKRNPYYNNESQQTYLKYVASGKTIFNKPFSERVVKHLVSNTSVLFMLKIMHETVNAKHA